MRFRQYIESFYDQVDNQGQQLVVAALAAWPDRTQTLMLADYLEEKGNQLAQHLRQPPPLEWIAQNMRGFHIGESYYQFYLNALRYALLTRRPTVVAPSNGDYIDVPPGAWMIVNDVMIDDDYVDDDIPDPGYETIGCETMKRFSVSGLCKHVAQHKSVQIPTKLALLIFLSSMQANPRL